MVQLLSGPLLARYVCLCRRLGRRVGRRYRCRPGRTEMRRIAVSGVAVVGVCRAQAAGAAHWPARDAVLLWRCGLPCGLRLLRAPSRDVRVSRQPLRIRSGGVVPAASVTSNPRWRNQAYRRKRGARRSGSPLARQLAYPSLCRVHGLPSPFPSRPRRFPAHCRWRTPSRRRTTLLGGRVDVRLLSVLGERVDHSVCLGKLYCNKQL
jgi:hypothetical protein